VVAASVPVPRGGMRDRNVSQDASLWWSRDGSTWSRDALSPALTGSTGFAQRPAHQRQYRFWRSATTWARSRRAGLGPQPTAGLDIRSGSAGFSNNLLTNGAYGLLVSNPENGKVSVWGFNRIRRLVALPQTGDLPTAPLTDRQPPGPRFGRLDGHNIRRHALLARHPTGS